MLLFIASLYVLSKRLYKKMYKKMYLLCIAFLCQLNKFFFMLLIFVGLSRVEGWTRWLSNHHMELGQVTEPESFSMGSCPLQTYLFEKLVTKIEGSQNYIHQNGKFKLPGVITTESSS